MKYLKLVIAMLLILIIIIYSVADINHGHGLEEDHVLINYESRV